MGGPVTWYPTSPAALPAAREGRGIKKSGARLLNLPSKNAQPRVEKLKKITSRYCMRKKAKKEPVARAFLCVFHHASNSHPSFL
jgi:hypothetical protein